MEGLLDGGGEILCGVLKFTWSLLESLLASSWALLKTLRSALGLLAAIVILLEKNLKF